MGRTLLYVPRLYTPEEVQMIFPKTPQDYEEKAEEFWRYVDEKVSPFAGRVKRVYHDTLHLSGYNGLELIAEIDERCYPIVKKLVDSGASVEATEDEALISEAEGWVKMISGRQDPGAAELFLENLEERNRHISKIIDRTLLEGEYGVIFIEPTRRINLPDSITVIRVCPFEPTDYVNST
ncbi:MAG: hypothetical protein QW390_02105, partial [Candidatus Bathyarchaeia archaeon]